MLQISESSLDQYLTREPQPAGFFIGTCPQCQTDHYSSESPEDKIEGSPCACHSAICCSECNRCSHCGDPVCPQCSVDVADQGDRGAIVCSTCYALWLEDQASGEMGLEFEFPIAQHVAIDRLKEVLAECESIAINRRVA